MTLNKFTAFLAAVVVMAGCTDDDPTGLNYEFSVAATPTTIAIAQDEYALIDATVTNLTLDQDVTGANVAWRTDDADVAVVVLYDHDGDGDEDEPTPEVPAVFGVGPGTTNIVATYRGAESTIAVTVTGDPITSGTLTAAGGRTTIFEGDTVTLIPTFRNAAGDEIVRPLVFASSDSSVAVADEEGFVTAEYKVGTTTITAVSDSANNDVEATLVITVVKRPVGYIEVEPESAVLEADETLELEARVFGANDEELEGRVVTWSSSNPVVASVDAETGVVTANAVVTATTVTITATSEGVTKDVFITVVP